MKRLPTEGGELRVRKLLKDVAEGVVFPKVVLPVKAPTISVKIAKGADGDGEAGDWNVEQFALTRHYWALMCLDDPNGVGRKVREMFKGLRGLCLSEDTKTRSTKTSRQCTLKTLLTIT